MHTKLKIGLKTWVSRANPKCNQLLMLKNNKILHFRKQQMQTTLFCWTTPNFVISRSAGCLRLIVGLSSPSYLLKTKFV